MANDSGLPFVKTRSTVPLRASEGSPSEQPDNVELLNVAEAARFLAVSPSTLYGWVWQRRISFVKLGRAVRFDKADLQEHVNRNKVHPRPPYRSPSLR
jgi:excisionase family DNA binding protein